MPYKFVVFEILRFVCNSIYYVSVLSLHIESTNSMIFNVLQMNQKIEIMFVSALLCGL